MSSSQFVKTLKTAGAQCIPLVNWIMNSGNAPKELAKLLIDLVNMAKWMMKENQQSPVQQELEKLSPSTTGTGRGGKNRELHRVGAGESSASTTTDPNTSFATPSIVEGKIEEKVDQKLVETPGYLHASSKFAIFSCNTQWFQICY